MGTRKITYQGHLKDTGSPNHWLSGRQTNAPLNTGRTRQLHAHRAATHRSLPGRGNKRLLLSTLRYEKYCNHFSSLIRVAVERRRPFGLLACTVFFFSSLFKTVSYSDDPRRANAQNRTRTHMQEDYHGDSLKELWQ